MALCWDINMHIIIATKYLHEKRVRSWHRISGAGFGSIVACVSLP